MSNIEMKDLCIFFPKSKLDFQINNLQATFKSNAITAIVGETGSGKSLLCMAIVGLLPENAIIRGSCLYEDQNTINFSEEQYRRLRKKIAYIPQSPNRSLHPLKKIKSQILETHKKDALTLETVRNYLNAFNIENHDWFLNAYPYMLSGGQKQIAVLISQIIGKKNWMIADEPTKGMDAFLRKKSFDSIRLIKEEWINSMIVITHDLDFARKISDYTCIMFQGKIMEYDETTTIFEDPNSKYTQALLDSQVSHGMIPIDQQKWKLIMEEYHALR